MASFNQIYPVSTKHSEQVPEAKERVAWERWQNILQYKQKFFQNQETDACPKDFMNQEVFDSWIRSRSLGVDPYSIVKHANLAQANLEELLQKYHLLIHITNSVIENIKDKLIACGDILYLFDKSRVALLSEGNWEAVQLFQEKNSRLGIVSDEHSEGTTAHELCIRLGKPVQLLGPEHYCIAFQDCISSAAPIRDENNEVTAVLVLLNSPFTEEIDKEVLEKTCFHSFGIVASLASSIETQYKVAKMVCGAAKDQEKDSISGWDFSFTMARMTAAHHALLTMMAMTNEGIVVTDRQGKILHVNARGLSLFNLPESNMVGMNIAVFFQQVPSLIPAIEKGETVTIEGTIGSGSNRQVWQISVMAEMNSYTQQRDIVVVMLSPVEKSVTGIVKGGRRGVALTDTAFEHLIGESNKLKKSIAMARQFSCMGESILLTGESGTGKELFAKAIHQMYRPQGPFIAVNCAAMPAQLIESEMFGYEGGSFTGAERSGRPGKIELAHGGTLFLDEIGDMPLELQAVLLRTLEDKQVMRIGGRYYKQVDFRLISATNKNLYQMVQENKFRGDLFFRLSVLPINIPPLRERGNDIATLSQYFVENYCLKNGWKIPQISLSAQKIIEQYTWPGNVRQLQNAMIYSVNMCSDGIIKPDNLPYYIPLEACAQEQGGRSDSSESIGEILCLEKLEKNAIETALNYTNKCVPSAAEILGISRSTLYRKLKEYHIGY